MIIFWDKVEDLLDCVNLTWATDDETDHTFHYNSAAAGKIEVSSYRVIQLGSFSLKKVSSTHF